MKVDCKYILFSRSKFYLFQLTKANDTTMLVIATVKANKTDLMMLADDRMQNLFNLTETALNVPLAQRLANRIKQVIQRGTAFLEKMMSTLMNMFF